MVNCMIKLQYFLIDIWMPQGQLWATDEETSSPHSAIATAYYLILPNVDWEPWSEVV